MTVTPARDLDSRAEIHDLVVRFYREIVFDELLAPVFIETAEVDWAVHIPKLIDFWCRVLLGEPGYDGFVLGAHRIVHEEEAFTAAHFDRWYSLFVETVDDTWRGPHAEAAKVHAARVAATLARRLLGAEWRPQTGPEPTGLPIVTLRIGSRTRDRAADSEGGESACWAHLVCPECGALEVDGEHRCQKPGPPKWRLHDDVQRGL